MAVYLILSLFVEFICLVSIEHNYNCLVSCDHEVMGSSPENSLLQKCGERLCT
jgi:hypothetical protein